MTSLCKKTAKFSPAINFTMKFLRFAIVLAIIINIGLPVANGAPRNFLKSKKANSLACPLIDDSQVVVYPSSCTTADGSITGITATGTGTLTFTWLTGNKAIIGNTADLLNVAPGTYTLEVYDQSKCIAATKTYIVGQRNNIVIDETQLKINPASCNATDGSVTGLNISNAVQYQWFNVAKRQVAATPNLTNVVNGLYTLTVTAADGCNTTKTYEVPSAGYFPQPVHMDTTIGSCNGSAGTIILTFNPHPSDPPYNYYGLTPSGGQVVSGVLQYGDGTPVKITVPLDIPNRVITLYLSDPKYCTTIVGQYSLPPVVFAIAEGPFFLVRNDACGRKTGGVFGLKLVGRANPEPQPYPIWTWTDSLGTVISDYPYELGSVGKGTYTATVKDYSGCVATKTFTVLDSAGEALPPGINGATLCLPGTVNLSIINPNPKFKYKLYDSTQSTEITENAAGIFQVKVTHTSKYYATTIDGLCESDQTPVTVTVIAPGVVIPNTFTPNGDGINDYWDIPHINDFPGAEISIFTRDGQLVFHSIDYSHPFNGNYNGKKLPVGVYYYVIDLKQPECFGKISGSLTIIR
jgi:gliding motility-associated-like protein